MDDKRKFTTKWLVKELGNPHKVKEFSSTLRDLNICDLSTDKHLDAVTKDGGAILIVLVSWYQLGMLSKLIEIKGKINAI